MWRLRYQREFRTKDPTLIITAVQCFPNIQDTVEKIAEYCNTHENQADPTRLEIESLYHLMNGRNFIPIHFEDTCPKLKNLGSTEFLGKSFFWCIGYRNPAIQSKHRDFRASSITLPSYQRFSELLQYSVKNKYVGISEWLFEQAVYQYVSEKTKDFTDEQKSRRFSIIANKSLRCLHPINYEDKIKPEQYNDFLYNMARRDIYEFMFNEYF